MSKTEKRQCISIVVPCYNEQDSIEPFIDALVPVMQSLEFEREIIFVDDGSTDATLMQLNNLSQRYEFVRILALSRNFGKEAALTAGLDHATGDAVIPIDVDLQDPVDLIPQMVEKWQAGAEVVLAKRKQRQADSLIRRAAAQVFYRVITFLSHAPIPRDVGDYRLMDRRVVEAIRQLPERSRYMKGLLSWPGYTTDVVEYARPQRAGGDSKWQLWKLFNHGLDGVFSFSTAPLRIWTYIGLLLSLFSLMYLLFIVIRTLIYGIDLPGYASIVSIVLFFSGINLIGLGILGEYVGRVFVEVKQRPIYIIKNKIGYE
jgi:glycosyltransferase involved in cell wall biosynthesis